MDKTYNLELRYTPPTEEEALEWVLDNPEGHVSAFACKYPNRYYEASSLIRKIRQQMIEGNSDANY